MNKIFDEFAVKQVKIELVEKLNKCNKARIQAKKEGRCNDEIQVLKDKQVVYSMLVKHLETIEKLVN